MLLSAFIILFTETNSRINVLSHKIETNCLSLCVFYQFCVRFVKNCV